MDSNNPVRAVDPESESKLPVGKIVGFYITASNEMLAGLWAIHISRISYLMKMDFRNRWSLILVHLLEDR